MLFRVGGGEKIDMNNERQVLGRRIAELREGRGWSQTDLARRTGLSLRTIGAYENRGPNLTKLNRLDAVFGGALLAGTSIETRPLDGMTTMLLAATNGPKVPRLAKVTEEELAAVDAEDEALAADMASDQDCVTSGMEPLGLLLDEVFGRLRAIERVVADLVREKSVKQSPAPKRGDR